MRVLSIEKLDELGSELQRLQSILWDFEEMVEMTVIHHWNFRNHRNIMKMTKLLHDLAKINRTIFQSDGDQLALVVDGKDTLSPLRERGLVVARSITKQGFAPVDPLITKEIEEFVTLLSPTSWMTLFRTSKKQLGNLAKYVDRLDHAAEGATQFRSDYVVKVRIIEKCACLCLDRLMPSEDNAYPGTLNDFVINRAA